MVENFDPQWVSVLDKSIQEWINSCTCPGWMFVLHKPHHFGEKYHTIACELSKVIYHVDIVEGQDRPQGMGQKEFDEKRAMAGLIVRTTKTILGMGKVVIMEIGLCVMQGIILMAEKGVLGLALIKKRCYQLKGVPTQETIWNMQKKDVEEVDAVTYSIHRKRCHIMTLKEPDYIILMMTT